MKDNSDIGEGHCASEWGGRETGKFLFTDDEVRALIAKEREACAKVADNFPTMHGFHSCYAVADAIRKRARQEPQG